MNESYGIFRDQGVESHEYDAGEHKDSATFVDGIPSHFVRTFLNDSVLFGFREKKQAEIAQCQEEQCGEKQMDIPCRRVGECLFFIDPGWEYRNTDRENTG